jgi:hypothetical protein
MNRLPTVFWTVIANIIFVIGLAQGIALGIFSDQLIVGGLVGGLLPFVSGVVSTLLFIWVLSGPQDANVGQKNEEVKDDQAAEE